MATANHLVEILLQLPAHWAAASGPDGTEVDLAQGDPAPVRAVDLGGLDERPLQDLLRVERRQDRAVDQTLRGRQVAAMALVLGAQYRFAGCGDVLVKRLKQGFTLDQFTAATGLAPAALEPGLSRNCRQNLLILQDNRYVCSEKGWDFQAGCGEKFHDGEFFPAYNQHYENDD